MKHLLLTFQAAITALTLVGCSADEPAPPPVRPVLSIIARSTSSDEDGFVGTIQPRYQTDRGFQVLGRITAYNVDVGDLVKRGDALAQLDPTTFALDVRAKEGDLKQAQSELSNAVLAEERTQKLVGEKVATQATLDANRQLREAAAASVNQAEANLTKSKEQLGYTVLTADEDGVVTSKDADIGNTVSIGQKVMTVARTDVREAVVDLPDNLVRTLPKNARFHACLQADPTIEVDGVVREIAPQADPSTRTHRVRITLDKIVEAFRLGTTITATPVEKPKANVVEIPSSAILEQNGNTKIWVVDDKTKTVRTTAIKIASRNERVVQVTEGIGPGTRVVVAGVHSLTEGQTVKLDPETEK